MHLCQLLWPKWTGHFKKRNYENWYNYLKSNKNTGLFKILNIYRYIYKTKESSETTQQYSVIKIAANKCFA